MYKYLRNNSWVCLLSTLLIMQNCQPEKETLDTPPAGGDTSPKGSKPNPNPSNPGPNPGDSEPKGSDPGSDGSDLGPGGGGPGANPGDPEPGPTPAQRQATIKRFKTFRDTCKSLSGLEDLWTNVNEAWSKKGGPLHEDAKSNLSKKGQTAASLIAELAPLVDALAKQDNKYIEKNLENESKKWEPYIDRQGDIEDIQALLEVKFTQGARKDKLRLVFIPGQNGVKPPGSTTMKKETYQITQKQAQTLSAYLQALQALAQDQT